MAEQNKKGGLGASSDTGSGTGSASGRGATESGGRIGTSRTAPGIDETSGMQTGSVGSGSGSTGTTGRDFGGAGTSRPTGPATSTRRGGDTFSGTGSSQTEGLMQQMRSSAGDALHTAKTNTVQKLEEQKSNLSHGLMTMADNIRQLGSNLSNTNQQDPITRIAADYSETAAEKIRGAADYFNTHDLETMYRDVEGLARRNPAVFLGGAFALGFLAARFFKSSSPRYANYDERRFGSTADSTGSARTRGGFDTPRTSTSM